MEVLGMHGIFQELSYQYQSFLTESEAWLSTYHLTGHRLHWFHHHTAAMFTASSRDSPPWTSSDVGAGGIVMVVGGWCRSWLRVNTSAHWSTSDTALSEVTAVVSTQLRLRQKTEESCSHQGPHNRGGHAGIRIVHLSTSWYIANSTTDFWHFFQILKDAIYVKLKNVKNNWHKYK